MNDAAERIDTDTGEVVTTLAKVVPAPGGSRLLALDSMSETDFAARLALLRTGQSRMRRIQQDLLQEDEDYGVIPGTGRGKPGDKNYTPGKATLLKPGAEKLLKFYGLVATFVLRRTYGDGVSAPMLHVDATCLIHVGDADGPVIAQGDATCNTWERKYRYRRGQNSCPSCASTIIRTKRGTPAEQWWCPPDKGGCGANFPKDDPDIAAQVVGDVENPDQRDLDNTCVKIAVKRSLVAGALLATATSGLFTQDMEDMVPESSRPVSAKRQADTDALEFAVRPVLDVLRKATTLAEFDAAVESERKGSRVAALDEHAKKYLATQAGKMRKALDAMQPAETMGQAAMRTALESAPEPSDADEPPSDEEIALALIKPIENAKTVAECQRGWAAIMLGAEWAAATPAARTLAEDTMRGIEAGIRDSKKGK